MGDFQVLLSISTGYRASADGAREESFFDPTNVVAIEPPRQPESR
jgi:hypothetical protein